MGKWRAPTKKNVVKIMRIVTDLDGDNEVILR